MSLCQHLAGFSSRAVAGCALEIVWQHVRSTTIDEWIFGRFSVQVFVRDARSSETLSLGFLDSWVPWRVCGGGRELSAFPCSDEIQYVRLLTRMLTAVSPRLFRSLLCLPQQQHRRFPANVLLLCASALVASAAIAGGGSTPKAPVPPVTAPAMAAAARRQPSVVVVFALLLAALLPAALARARLTDNVYIADDDVIGSYCEVILGSPSDPFSSVDICLKVHR
ncbi:unnamed protein product [Closterium sp. Yama58-4]|nr:unnamed protein product [Closterium sp. Yama58-4]